MTTEKLDPGRLRTYVQGLRWQEEALVPASSKAELEDDIEWLAMSVIELSNVSEEMRKTPAGIQIPASFGKAYCLLHIINYRGVDIR